MKVELKSDFPITDDSCKQATGKTIGEWMAQLEQRPELEGKRRETINFLYDAMGRGKDTWWATTIWVERERSKGVVLKDGRPDGYNICATKTITAPLHQVFEAFTGPMLASWFGDDAKATADGSLTDQAGNQATAIRVREGKDIRYKWRTAGGSDETDVDVMFAEKAGKTGITLNHGRIQTRDEADGLRRAWGECFNRLKANLEAK